MLRSLGDYVGFPAVIALVLGGVAILVLASTIGGQFGQIVAAFIGIIVVIAGLAMMFAVWIQRMNADIGSNRQDIRRDLDEIMDEDSED